jgi:hypothetical protein
MIISSTLPMMLMAVILWLFYDGASVVVVRYSKARFVTARAISMKLGVRIPLGNTISDI